MLVAVTPDDQAKLDATEVGSELELVVQRIDFPRNRLFADPARYPLLDSAGLRLAIDDAQREGEALRLKGRRAT